MTAGGDAGPEPARNEVREGPLQDALASMQGLRERPLAEHPDVYQAIHTELTRALSAIDDA